MSAEAPLEIRVAFELAGFRVIARPVSVDELVEKVPDLASIGGSR